MQTYKLTLKSRESGKKAAVEMRNKNAIGVVYGHGIDTVAVEGDWMTVNKLLQNAGTSHIIQLSIDDGETRDALLKDIDFDPVTNQMRHFDLYVVKKGEKIHAEVPIELEGDAPAAKVGLLIHQLIGEIEVETLPAHLPESFKIDISELKEVGDTIYVNDISLPEGVEVDEDMLQQPIIKVDAPREEEPEPEVEEPVDAGEVPSEHGGDEDGEESGDGSGEEPAEEKSE